MFKTEPRTGCRFLLPLLLAACVTTAQAQSWPDRPIKFISSQAAGNGTDIIARFVAEQLGSRIGQPVIVENRPGGGNIIGTQAAARSAPDGYTFFFATAAALVTDPFTFKSLPYDPMKAFVPVARVAEVTFVVMANPNLPANNLQELIALAKAEPDKLTIATSGPKRFSGMVVSWLNKLAGTRISQVPYTAMGPGIQDAIAGRVPLVILSVPEAAASLSSGALKPLAVTSLERVKTLPDVPTIAETFPGFDAATWFVLVGPTGMPREAITRINAETKKIVATADFQQRLDAIGMFPDQDRTPDEINAYIKAEIAKWAKVIADAGVKPAD